MIITRTPFRITLGGGGTDIPEFYEKHGGFWINATINKYVYVCVNLRFEKQLRIVYSQLENPETPEAIKHPIIKALFEQHSIRAHTEFITYADLPAGSGLGSSGAFTVGSILALTSGNGPASIKRREDIAESAYYIERTLLGRPIGKQDQYSASFGGMRAYRIDEKGKVTSQSIYDPEIEDKLMLIYTGEVRDSMPILNEVRKSETQLKEIKELGQESFNAIIENRWNRLGEIMDEHWYIKQSITKSMSSSRINQLYDRLKKAGAIGGKLVGAGGGGFLLIIVPNDYVKQTILREVLDIHTYTPFEITHTGTEVIQFA